jgi:hypothetical protein
LSDLVKEQYPNIMSKPEIVVRAARTTGAPSVYHEIRVRRASAMEECRKT